MKDLLSRDLSDSEPIWHWLVWCMIGLVDVSDRRIPTVILIGIVFVLYAFVAHPNRSFPVRLMICVASGAAIVNNLGMEVSQSCSITPLIVGIGCGTLAALGPAIIRYFLLSIALGLCVVPCVQTVFVAEALGVSFIKLNSIAKTIIGFMEIFVLGLPGVAYYFLESVRKPTGIKHIPLTIATQDREP